MEAFFDELSPLTGKNPGYSTYLYVYQKTSQSLMIIYSHNENMTTYDRLPVHQEHSERERGEFSYKAKIIKNERKL